MTEQLAVDASSSEGIPEENPLKGGKEDGVVLSLNDNKTESDIAVDVANQDISEKSTDIVTGGGEPNTCNPPPINDFDEEDEDDDNGDDDVVNVIIKPAGKGGIYKTGATYQARSVSHTTQHSKAARQGIELDDPGDIQGVPTVEFNLSTLGEEDKPWKRPGADITDYFNYGFTEETWVQYCEKQKILRQEYANATLKPVISSGGTGLLQRLRASGCGLNSRSYDGLKHTNINVVNLSNVVNARTLPTGMGQKSTPEAATALLTNMTANSGGIMASFTQPPPGYPNIVGQTDVTGSFANSLSGLPNIGASAILPNMSLPPPLLNALSTWPAPVGVPNLLTGGDNLIDPGTSQIPSIIEQPSRSPDSMYDGHGSRRKSRHYHGDDENYFDRDSYRSRRRSRSGSRDRHSRHHRWSPLSKSHRDSGHSERDYDRRSSRRSHRTREDRFSAGPADDIVDLEGFCPPSAVISGDRRSDRDRVSRDRSDRNISREKSNHRSHRRDVERSSKSSRSGRRRSRSRSSHVHDTEGFPKSPIQQLDAVPKTSDPLVAAAAAAANIAIALGAPSKSTP